MNRLGRLRTLRLAVFAAFALLVAQLGAMTHTYAHAADGVTGSAKQQLPGSRDLCTDCLNFAPLLAPAGATGALAFTSPPARSTTALPPPPAVPGLAPLLAFRSRAPPTTH